MLSISEDDQYTYDTSLQLLKRIYNSFSYPKNFFNDMKLESFTVLDNFELSKQDDLFIDKLYDKLVDYCHNNYDIFEYKSKDEFVNLLNKVKKGSFKLGRDTLFAR